MMQGEGPSTRVIRFILQKEKAVAHDGPKSGDRILSGVERAAGGQKKDLIHVGRCNKCLSLRGKGGRTWRRVGDRGAREGAGRGKKRLMLLSPVWQMQPVRMNKKGLRKILVGRRKKRGKRNALPRGRREEGG